MDRGALLMAVLLLIAGAVASASAGRAYDFHKNLRKTDYFLSKIVGFNLRYLDNRTLWIRHFRAYVILIVVLCLCIAFGTLLG